MAVVRDGNVRLALSCGEKSIDEYMILNNEQYCQIAAATVQLQQFTRVQLPIGLVLVAYQLTLSYATLVVAEERRNERLELLPTSTHLSVSFLQQ